MQCGLLERTPKGRVATNLAYEHLDLKTSQKTIQLVLTKIAFAAIFLYN